MSQQVICRSLIPGSCRSLIDMGHMMQEWREVEVLGTRVAIASLVPRTFTHFYTCCKLLLKKYTEMKAHTI